MEILSEYRRNKSASCGLIVIDNFYENPMEVRNFALKQEYIEQKCIEDSYCVGKRSKSFACHEHKERFQKILEPLVGKIKDFPFNTENGKFQYSTSNEHSWVHYDTNNKYMNYAGIIYLTPDAPIESGTAFYQYIDGTMNSDECKLMKSDYIKYDKDMTKWKLVDKVGNIFNRLVLFDSSRYHTSVDYFGSDLYNSRLYQLFFFSTE
jgi:hypothetical protein